MPTKPKRTHSEPELPQLLPLGARPHTSYESQLAPKEYHQFPPDIIAAMAKALQVSVEDEAEYHWVIRDCLLALKEERCKCEMNARGDLVYVTTHPDLSEDTNTVHPVVEFHRKLAERLNEAGKDFRGKRRGRFWKVQELVFAAIMGERDVRRVATPSILEEVMSLLGMEPLDEPYLIWTLKVAIEDAYFAMKENPTMVTTENCISVEKLIVKLEIERIKFLQAISPSKLLYCVECETALADVASAATHDVFCNQCFVQTHGSGHRMDHPAVFIEQTVCSECEQKAALIRCQDCADLFCYECFMATHKAGKRLRHCVRLPTTTYCMECDDREAVYLCTETEDLLCTACCAKVHKKGARQNHALYGLRKAAYSKELFGDNVQRVMMILEQHVAQAQPLTPWILFWDEAFNPFWYNFFTREKVRATVTDIVNPPTTGMDATSLRPEDQVAEPLPGQTDLIQTHAAKKASTSAVFHVPPPMSIKFRSPATAAESMTTAVYAGDPLATHGSMHATTNPAAAQGVRMGTLVAETAPGAPQAVRMGLDVDVDLPAFRTAGFVPDRAPFPEGYPSSGSPELELLRTPTLITYDLSNPANGVKVAVKVDEVALRQVDRVLNGDPPKVCTPDELPVSIGVAQSPDGSEVKLDVMVDLDKLEELKANGSLVRLPSTSLAVGGRFEVEEVEEASWDEPEALPCVLFEWEDDNVGNLVPSVHVQIDAMFLNQAAESAESDEAALRLQCAYRQKEARKVVEEKRAERDRQEEAAPAPAATEPVPEATEAELADAATKLQANFRGQAARQKLEEELGVPLPCRERRGGATVENAGGQAGKSVRASAKVAGKAKEKSAAHTEKRDEAAVKVQKVFRGNKARREVEQRKHEGLPATFRGMQQLRGKKLLEGVVPPSEEQVTVQTVQQVRRVKLPVRVKNKTVLKEFVVIDHHHIHHHHHFHHYDKAAKTDRSVEDRAVNMVEAPPPTGARPDELKPGAPPPDASYRSALVPPSSRPRAGRRKQAKLPRVVPAGAGRVR